MDFSEFLGWGAPTFTLGGRDKDKRERGHSVIGGMSPAAASVPRTPCVGGDIIAHPHPGNH